MLNQTTTVQTIIIATTSFILRLKDRASEVVVVGVGTVLVTEIDAERGEGVLEMDVVERLVAPRREFGVKVSI